MEKWKDIKGYEGSYQVSNEGRIRSIGRWVDKNGYGIQFFDGRIMKQFENNGYLMVTLRLEGKKQNYKVHRLVAEAFLANPDGLPCINHKDCNRQNNTVSNLEWCSYAYNNSYRFTHKAA